jgi:hypothetical protein
VGYAGDGTGRAAAHGVTFGSSCPVARGRPLAVAGPPVESIEDGPDGAAAHSEWGVRKVYRTGTVSLSRWLTSTSKCTRASLTVRTHWACSRDSVGCTSQRGLTQC